MSWNTNLSFIVPRFKIVYLLINFFLNWFWSFRVYECIKFLTYWFFKFYKQNSFWFFINNKFTFSWINKRELVNLIIIIWLRCLRLFNLNRYFNSICSLLFQINSQPKNKNQSYYKQKTNDTHNRYPYFLSSRQTSLNLWSIV